MADAAALAPVMTKLGAEGDPVPLDGGITNRNYRVRLRAGGEAVLRMAGKDTALLGIDREGERVANAAAAELGIAPAVLGRFDGVLVTRFVPCKPVFAATLRADPEQVGRALRRFHDDGPDLPTRFWVPDLVERYADLAELHGHTLPEGVELARDAAARIAWVLPLDDPRPCHNDLLLGNLIDAGGTILFVDWEYAAMGHRLFDLGNLAVNNAFDESAERALLEAYDGDSERLLPALRLMRVMSDCREAMWGVAQGAISDLDFDFAAYADEHFGRLRAATDDPDFERWIRDAAPA